MNIIIIGIQGSGKGTQAALLHKKYGWPHINLGKLLRDHIIRKTELGLVVKEYIDKGRLVPDDLVIKLIKPVLDAADSGFILDGFPAIWHRRDFYWITIASMVWCCWILMTRRR